MNNPYANAYVQQVPVQVPQYAPQGIFGDIVSAVAPTLGSAVGNAFGHQQLGSAAGQLAGQLGSYIPFSAGPGQLAAAPAQYAPQGIFGDIVSAVAPTLGSAVGNAFGHQQLGSAAGQLAGQLGSYIPFSAGPGQVVAAAPQYAPQGFFGDLIKTVAPIAGNVIGGLAGQPQLGAQVGGIAGQLGGLLPFSAGPGQQVVAAAPQYAPQGFIGDLFKTVAPIAGNVIGGLAGQPQLGQQIGGIAGQFGGLLPFSAGPGQQVVAAAPQFAPQGFFGDLVKTVAPIAGNVIGGLAGQPQLGQQIGGIAGQFGGLLPFSAGPGQQVVAAAPQYAPQGIIGDLFKTVAPIAGNVIGGLAGQPQLGQQIGGIAGQFGGLLPFSAGPGQQVVAAAPQFAPQGIIGDILSTVAPIAGTVLGGIVGQPILGGMAGGLAGNAAKMIPFSAGPVYGGAIQQPQYIH